MGSAIGGVETVLLLLLIAAGLLAIRYRGRQHADTLFCIGSIALLVLFTKSRGEGTQAQALRFLGGLLLLSQPYFLLRLIRRFWHVPQILHWAALACTLGGAALLLLLDHPRPAWVTSLNAGYFTAVQGYAAVAFTLGARRAAGVTRWRLRLAALGAWAVIGMVTLEGTARLTGQQPTAAIQGLLAFTLLGGYYFGLATPRWLRRTWQRGQLYRFLKLTAARDPVDREQYAPTDLDKAAMGAVVARTTAVLLGTGDRKLVITASSDPAWVQQTIDLGAGLLARAIAQAEPMSGTAADCEPALARIVGRDHVVVVPIVRKMRCWGVLVVIQRQGSLFPGEDPDLLAKLCRHAADILDHAQLVNDQRRQLEAENARVLEASRLKGEFLANMSHELRTPLNAIIGFTDLLYQNRVTPAMPEYKEFLGHVRSSGRHLLQLINDVLDLSKVEAGKFMFFPEPVDPLATVKEVLGILHATILNKGIRVSHEVDDTLTDIVIDPARFRQVLYNYLSNALKFTNKDGRVVVRVRAEGTTMLRLEVEDSGIGIASEDLQKLFIEFHQLETGATKTQTGTGLGLALTKRLVEAQGGRVEVTSVLGQGSTFSAVLPRQTAAIVGTMDSRKPPAPVANPPEASVSDTVLVVDDDAASLDLMCMTLTQLGYHVRGVRTAEDGLRAAEVARPLAVVLDLVMPTTDGMAFVGKFRKLPGCEAVPVIVWTVKDLVPDDYRRLRAVTQGFIAKGSGDKVLATELGALLPAPSIEVEAKAT